jgi:hypothetical protein
VNHDDNIGTQNGYSSDVPPRASVGKDGVFASNKKKRDRLEMMYTQMGLLIGGINQVDGIIICNTAHDRATEMIRVAQHHPRMMKAIDRLTEGNDYIAAMIGYGSTALAILVNHDKIPHALREYLENIGRNNASSASNQGAATPETSE